MNIISGCPRSGTSLMMDLMREAFGDGRIMGKKFPQVVDIAAQQEQETDEQYAVRSYILNKRKQNMSAQSEESKDLNPNGFWEMEYTVQGVKYAFGDRERLDKILTEEPKSFCKIVSQGLINSDPRYINKIIYMVRHPREVAKSQERLKHQGPITGEDAPVRNGKAVKIHSPEMYINVTTAACQWFLAYPEVPVLYVYYNDLINNPQQTLTQISQFLEEDIADIENVASIVDTKLRRSQPEDVENDLWEISETIYELFTQKKYAEVVKYAQEQQEFMRKKKEKIFCMRTNTPVDLNVCKLCRSCDNPYAKNQIPVAERKGIDWQNEPCIYECTRKEDGKLLTIQESIDHNFWKDGIQPKEI